MVKQTICFVPALYSPVQLCSVSAVACRRSSLPSLSFVVVFTLHTYNPFPDLCCQYRLTSVVDPLDMLILWVFRPRHKSINIDVDILCVVTHLNSSSGRCTQRSTREASRNSKSAVVLSRDLFMPTSQRCTLTTKPASHTHEQTKWNSSN